LSYGRAAMMLAHLSVSPLSFFSLKIHFGNHPQKSVFLKFHLRLPPHQMRRHAFQGYSRLFSRAIQKAFIARFLSSGLFLLVPSLLVSFSSSRSRLLTCCHSLKFVWQVCRAFHKPSRQQGRFLQLHTRAQADVPSMFPQKSKRELASRSRPVFQQLD